VFFGAGVGGMARHAVDMAGMRLGWTSFPASTLIVNVTGSSIMGLAAGLLAFRAELPQPVRLFLMTGVLGGYTTFSAFSLDTAILWERGRLGLAALYVAGSVALSIAGLFAGLGAVRALLRA
jgi:CrcB protein